MDYQNILEFVGMYPVCTLATCNDNTPHVRGFLTNLIEGKIYFTTSALKTVGRQIMQNPRSELCYFSSDFSTMLRIRTTLRILDDREIKQHLIDTRDYLKGFSADDESFLLLGLSDSRATFWSLSDNLHEDMLEVIAF